MSTLIAIAQTVAVLAVCGVVLALGWAFADWWAKR